MDNGVVSANGTNKECLPILDREWFYMWMLIPSVVAIVIAMLLQRRNEKALGCCYGRPSLAFVGNLLDGRTNRLAYAAAFGLVASALLNIFFGFFPFPRDLWLKDDLWVPALWGILAVVVYAVDFFPLFACITLAASGIGFGYFMGAFFAWAWLASLLDEFLECDTYKNIDPTEFLIIFDMPSLICAAFLSIWFPVGMLMSMCNSRGKKDNKQQPWYDRLTSRAFQKGKSSDGMGVGEACKSVCYVGIPGFRYSTVMISTSFVAFCTLYKVYCVCMVYVVPVFNSIDIPSPEEVNSTLYSLGLGDYYPKDNATVVAERISLYFDVMEACLIVALTVAFALCTFTLGFILSNYRSNILALYKGIRLVLPPKLSRRSPGSYAEASMKYFGYQVIFIAFGFFVQTLVLFVVALLLAFVIFLPVFYGYGLDVLLQFCFTAGPWIVLAMIVLGTQAWASYEFFILKYQGAPTIALNNRRSFYNCWYVMFIFEFFWAWVVAVFRVIQGVFFGCVLIARCDLSMLNWRFEHQDVALQSYVGMLQVEVAHSHPVLLSFCKILLRPATARWRNRMLQADVENDVTDTLKKQLMQKRKLIRNRWFMAYTLLWNPNLRQLRKQRIKYRNERRKGAPRTVSMSTQTPRHIAIQTKPEELLLNEFFPAHPMKAYECEHDFNDANLTYNE